ncbi:MULTISPECIES: HPr-rel-A system PqqD family peptide chaperone [unclassified Thioalkalivibrio]|uniref:HPr-rel-A system PqqD family peptide chaperone n=1 Tax=unclassified Thioalkalivibrio TaxID=2621013 RepID=UPI000374DE88|nr:MULTISPECIES: HPr-rel-A system PqqD family peptide chaperone [unclassified Thioalkalivibrio]
MSVSEETPLALIPLPAAHVRAWGEAVVVYDQRCGATHVLQPPLADLFQALQGGPMTPEALFEYLEQRYDAAEGELEDAMQAGLSQLRQHDLVRRVPESREA